MSKITAYHQPCSSCGSSDAVCTYEDQSKFCFSCRKYTPSAKGVIEGTAKLGFKPEPEDDARFSRKDLSNFIKIEAAVSGPIPARALSKHIVDFFGVKVSYNEDRVDVKHAYPYSIDEYGIAQAYKIRDVKDKAFSSIGKIHGLFGQHQFRSGGKRLVITEGEIDAMSIAQSNWTRNNAIYPVVSIRSASTYRDDLIENLAWIRGFDEVVIAFDNDGPGKKATEEACRIIGMDKVRVADFGKYKDSNEVLVKAGNQELLKVVWDARKYVPAGIIDKVKLWDALLKYNEIESIPYPKCLDGLNSKLRGMRPGEIDLFISGTGSGKSTVFREIVLHLLATTDAKIGIVSLEEAPSETARRLSGMYLNINTAEVKLEVDALKVGFDAVFGDDRILLLDHQGSVNDDSLLDMMDYMALMGCTYILLDHITIAVSEGSKELTGNEAIDATMNKLLKLVKKHPVWLGVISHLRKAPAGQKSFEDGNLPSIDDIKGSGSIKQISFAVIAFARGQADPDPIIRSMIILSVLKNRYSGLTGPVAPAYYNIATGRLQANEPTEDFKVLLPSYDAEDEEAKELAIEQISFLAAYEGYYIE